MFCRVRLTRHLRYIRALTLHLMIHSQKTVKDGQVSDDDMEELAEQLGDEWMTTLFTGLVICNRVWLKLYLALFKRRDVFL